LQNDKALSKAKLNISCNTVMAPFLLVKHSAKPR